MELACLTAPERGDTNRLLADLAERAAARGLRLCGTVQVNTPLEGTHHCDMDVTVLPAGPVLRISQSLGPEARGCRLNPHVLETAVRHTQEQLARGVDMMIVNKFGKHEAEGRGFREVIAEALAQGIPVIVGLNGLNEVAFAEFAGDFATVLPADPAALDAWAAKVAPEAKACSAG